MGTIILHLTSIISIPQDIKSPLSNSTNYMGITLVNAMDQYLSVQYYLAISIQYFDTSDTQFSFKQQYSTVVYCLLYHEEI